MRRDCNRSARLRYPLSPIMQDEKGHGPHLLTLMTEFAKNYRNGLARFRLLPFLEDEDQVISCADELNSLKLDYRDDLEEFEALIGLVTIDQPLFCWLQDIKRAFNNLYSLRCGRDVLLREWLNSYLERDDLLESAKAKSKGKEEGGKNPLQARVEEAFAEQDLPVPETYKPGYKEARAKQAKERLQKMEAEWELANADDGKVKSPSQPKMDQPIQTQVEGQKA